MYRFSVKPTRHLMGLPLPRLQPCSLRCCRSQNRHHLTDVIVHLKRYDQYSPAKVSDNCNGHCDRTSADRRLQSFPTHRCGHVEGTLDSHLGECRKILSVHAKSMKTLFEEGRQQSCKVLTCKNIRFHKPTIKPSFVHPGNWHKHLFMQYKCCSICK